ncbi:MAG: GFA family protein [Rudaea sp.]
MKYKGSCHCGRIAYEVEGDLQQAMECNCSHCQRKGLLLWFVPAAQFNLLTPAEDMSTYTFNKHAIRHRFCPTCGTQPFASGKDRNGNETAAINVRCLEGVDIGALTRIAVDGRSF